MNLYTKLFGRLMDEAGEGGGAGGGAVDRGDDFVPTGAADDTSPADDPPADDPPADDPPADDPPADDPPRDASGKFTKKDKDDDRGPLIPKSRFDEQLSKERAAREAAERRLQEFERSAQSTARSMDLEKAASDVAELRKQERKALLDGDDEKAAQLADKADRLNRQIAIEEARAAADAAGEDAQEAIRMDMTIERLEEKYPALDKNSELFDQDLVDDVLDKQMGLMERERLPPSRALARAAELVMKRYVPAPAPVQDKDPAPSAGLGAERKAEAVARNVAAARRQPGDLKDLGLDSDKAGQTKQVPSVADMTFDEFMKLPEETRARMRGDYS